MNPKKFFQQSRIPTPPPELREQILARTLRMSESHKDFVDRLWENRPLQVGWLLSVLTLALLLLFWNPPAPGLSGTPAPRSQTEISLNGDWEPELVELYQQRIQLSRQTRDEAAFLVPGVPL